MWLRDMLPAALQQYGISFRVMTYGYSAELSNESSNHFLNKIPVQLEKALMNERVLVGLRYDWIIVLWMADRTAPHCSHRVLVS